MSRQDPNTAPNQNTSIDFRVWVNRQTSRWDDRADAYATSANRLGLTVAQITKELCTHGYAASKEEVLHCLDRHGVQNIPRTTVRWDAQAEAFTLAAHQIGQTEVQILNGLSNAGCIATIPEIAASLNRQGV